KKILSDGKISGEIKIAYLSAANSLNNLAVKNNANSSRICGIENCRTKVQGVIPTIFNKTRNATFAGLPWFFQFWSRDALISLKAMSKIDKNFSEKILLDYLNKIGNDGRLPNLIGHHDSKMPGSADAAGWLFARCSDLIKKIENNKSIINSIKSSIKLIKQNKEAKSPSIKEYTKKCSLLIAKKEKENERLLYEIECSLEKSVNGLLKNHTKEQFDLNSPKETWMDTDFGDDGREGFRIEIQALRLNMFKLMYDLTLNHKYKILENTLKIKVKNKFWNEKILADGLNDFTIRPNIFIASYIYPELLNNKEWETCFENSLKSLWLGWGGLSTIDKNHKLFTDANTGENNQSYHRGDSWFWINNLAAIELNKINNKKFNSQIQKIISASTEDILWKGCIGCASELSSAKELSSQGCFNQAWSNAMYV
ncbi:MAG: amylo-alpha-1,6-glucosidase, partial [Nanoarchaeota archaeon]